MDNGSAVKAVETDSEGEGKLHEPEDRMMSCFRLELHHPELVSGMPRKDAWAELRSAHRRVGQAVQLAVRNVIMHVGEMRAAGKIRFATPSEKMNAKLGVPLPSDCYQPEDMDRLGDILTDSMRTSDTTEYVYSSVSRKLLMSEFSKSKLNSLLKGDVSFPVMRNVGLMMRNRNWSIRLESRIVDGKTYVDPVVETSAFRKGKGGMILHCRSLHAGKLERATTLLEELATAGQLPETSDKWRKGALIIRPVRRPGQMEKWEILIPYQAPRKFSGGQAIMSVHRSVANMLTASVMDGSKVKVHHYPGRAVVALKSQLYARRKSISRDLAARLHPMRQANRKHYKALARLSDAEARATQTELWRAARWVQGVAEAAGAQVVFLDDFTSFDPDRPGPPMEPYVRRFPWSDLKDKVVDSLKRRAGIKVQERKSAYITQKCPKCGFTSKDNLVKMPKIRGVEVEGGWWKCGNPGCDKEGDPDDVAGENLLADCREKFPGLVDDVEKVA